MNHVDLGAFIPFVIALVIYVVRGFRASFLMLVLTPEFMAFGALWASGPDIFRVIGRHDLYNRLMLDPRCNIFLWHYSIDRVEGGTPDSPWFVLALLVMLAALLAAAWRELYLAENAREPLTADNVTG